MSIENVMRSVNNFFEYGYIDGSFSIDAEGEMTPSGGIRSGQFVAISGSMFHDGVHQFVSGRLDSDCTIPENFKGRIWLLAPPASFLKICDDIEKFEANNSPTGIVSEHFGNYSRTMATGSDGVAVGWRTVFSGQLKPYMRMFTEVHC